MFIIALTASYMVERKMRMMFLQQREYPQSMSALQNQRNALEADIRCISGNMEKKHLEGLLPASMLKTLMRQYKVNNVWRGLDAYAQRNHGVSILHTGMFHCPYMFPRRLVCSHFYAVSAIQLLTVSLIIAPGPSPMLRCFTCMTFLSVLTECARSTMRTDWKR